MTAMPLDLIDQDRFHQLARASAGKVEQPLFRVSVAEPEIVSHSARTIRFCFSDGSVDRAGDTIDPDGWELERFKRNPTALWAHDSSAPPIGRASNVGVTGSRLMGDIEFASAETYEFADTVYRLVTGGFIRAVSVGFLPLEYSFADDHDRPWGIDFKRQELLEISVCPVPMNANALVEASEGIDTSPLLSWSERQARSFASDEPVSDDAIRCRLAGTIARLRVELSEHRPTDVLPVAAVVANAGFRLRRW